MKFEKLIYIICLFTFVISLDEEYYQDKLGVLFKCDESDLEKTADEFALKYGLLKLNRISILNGYLFQIPESKRNIIDIRDINNDDFVEFSEIQTPYQFYNRIVPFSDPLYLNQWHYFNDYEGHINIQSAWYSGYDGSGISIGIVDEGILSTHDDISPNFNHSLSHNYNQANNNVNPTNNDEIHGTLVAGAVAAKNDGVICGVGVAHNASISGIVILQDKIIDAIQAQALVHKIDSIDIYSNSWGPNDDGKSLKGPGKFTKLALEEGSRVGRNGKGAIYVWAGGNGGYWDNCNYDGFASWRKAVTISSVNRDGKFSYFSEECASNLAVAPGEEIVSLNISSNSECSSQFLGTSASTSIASGIIALMLQANPDLSWLDVQRVIIETSRKIDPNDRSWVRNGGGYWVSHKYGYGLLDASAAIDRSIELNGEENLNEEERVYYHNTKESFTGSISKTIEVKDSCIIHHVELKIRVTYYRFGDLYIDLISPYGTRSIFAKPHADDKPNVDWTFTSKLLWGEDSNGTWTVNVASNNNKKVGTLNEFQLYIYGHDCELSKSNNILKMKSNVMITLIISILIFCL